VKPAEHPEFFRWPPPEGTSRESSIRLDAQGEFWHEGSRVARRDMRDAFSRWLARHPDDGRFILVNGYDWTYITVDDVPYFVRAVRRTGGGPELTLSDGSVEPLGGETLEFDESGALYVRVKASSESAKFTPSAQRDLEPFLVERDGEIRVLGVDGPAPVRSRSLP
jgi:uncharacterized protein